MSTKRHPPPAIRMTKEDLACSAAYINAKHGAAEQAGRSSLMMAKTYLEYSCEAGEELLRVKGGLGHGSFGEWIRENLACDHRTANRYMKRAAEGLKFDMVSNSSPDKAAVFLSKTPEEEDTEPLPGTGQGALEADRAAANGQSAGDQGGEGPAAEGEQDQDDGETTDQEPEPDEIDQVKPPVVEELPCGYLAKTLSKVSEMLLGVENRWPMPDRVKRMSAAGKKDLPEQISGVIRHLNRLKKEIQDAASGKTATARPRR